MRVPSYVKEEEVMVPAADVTQAAFAESTADNWGLPTLLPNGSGRVEFLSSLSRCSALDMDDSSLGIVESCSALSPASQKFNSEIRYANKVKSAARFNATTYEL
jgi:hypothetical protein